MKQKCLFSLTCIAIFTISIICGCQEQNKIEKPDNAAKTTAITEKPAKAVTDSKLTPTIKFAETALDFNQVGPGTITTKELKFQNTGEGVLKISEISQCCGIVATNDKEQYQPGETGTLTIEFHASGTIGVLERQPIVFSNDPKNPKVQLHVKAEIVQKVVWEPEKFKLILKEENGACPKITIKSLDGQEFGITGIRSTGNCITADFNPKNKKTEHVIDLKADMKKIPDETQGIINISLNHPLGDTAIVYFEIVPKYELSPRQIIEFHLKENEPITKQVKIINNYNEPFEIVSTSSKENYMKLIDSKKINNDFELNIEIKPPAVNDKRRFSDIFYINLSNGEQLALTCTGYQD
jgi:hypothetical protein